MAAAKEMIDRLQPNSATQFGIITPGEERRAAAVSRARKVTAATTMA